MYAQGDGVEKDLHEAVRWFRPAAEQGSAKARIYLGGMYARGEGVEKDRREAVRWFSLARKSPDAGIAAEADRAWKNLRGGNAVVRRHYRYQIQGPNAAKIFVDGVIEAQNPAGELFGRARLCELLYTLQEASPQAVIDAVLKAVAAFTGTATLEDDVTMIVMKVN